MSWFAVLAIVGLGALSGRGSELRRQAAGFGEVVLEAETPGAWRFSLSAAEESPGVSALKIVLDAPEEAVPPSFRLRFEHAGVGADHLWSPYDDRY